MEIEINKYYIDDYGDIFILDKIRVNEYFGTYLNGDFGVWYFKEIKREATPEDIIKQTNKT